MLDELKTICTEEYGYKFILETQIYSRYVAGEMSLQKAVQSTNKV